MFVNEILLNAEIFHGLIRYINSAKKTLVLSSFVLDGRASPGPEIAQALNLAARRNVHISLLYSMSAVVLKRQQTNQAESFLMLLDGGPAFEIRQYNHYLFDAMHMKILIADSCNGMIFGANIEPLVISCGWRDTGLSFSGVRASHTILKHFYEVWTKSTPHTLSYSVKKRTFGNDRMKRTISDCIPVHTNIPYRIAVQTGCSSCLPGQRISQVTKSLVRTICSARSCVDLITPNLADARILTCLVNMVETHGVRVRIITTLEMNVSSYSALGLWTNREVFHRYGHLFAFRFSNRTRCDGNGQNCQTCVVNGAVVGANHSKFVCIDGGVRVVIGSANLEPISMTSAVELNVELCPDEPRTQARFQDVFTRFWKQAVVTSSGLSKNGRTSS